VCRPGLPRRAAYPNAQPRSPRPPGRDRSVGPGDAPFYYSPTLPPPDPSVAPSSLTRITQH